MTIIPGRFGPAMAQVLLLSTTCVTVATTKGRPTGRSKGSLTTTSSTSTAPRPPPHLRRAFAHLPPPRAASGRTRSSGVTRRSRSAPHTRSTTTTGSSRATANRRSASSAGCPPATILSWWRGHPGPAGGTRPTTTSPRSACRSRRMPHAAGLAWGKLRGEPAVAMVFFGDGATSERIPRGRTSPPSCRPRWSSSATTTIGASRRRSRRKTAAETLADKAVGYGMPGVRVDGTDVLAVHEAAREAVERALGRRPDLHRGGDVSRRTARDGRRSGRRLHRRERVEDERRRQPVVGRFDGYLRRAGSSRTTSPQGSGARRWS